jgi:hypothetical protein
MNGDVPGELSDTKELLLEELKTFEESIWRSEETGEKRFEFFITLVTAVIGGLGALWTIKPADGSMAMSPKELTCYASFALLLFGLLSFMRMRHRDSVTEGYKRATAYVRDFYRRMHSDMPPKLQDYDPPLKSLERHRQTTSRAAPPETNESVIEKMGRYLDKRYDKVRRGGYTVSLGVMNGLLLAVGLLAMDVAGDHTEEVAVAAGALLVLLLWGVSDKPANAPDKGRRR